MVCLGRRSGEEAYSAIPFATPRYKKVGGQHHVPVALSPGKSLVPLVQVDEWAWGSVWSIRSPDGPSRC